MYSALVSTHFTFSFASKRPVLQKMTLDYQQKGPRGLKREESTKQASPPTRRSGHFPVLEMGRLGLYRLKRLGYLDKPG